MSFDYFYGQQSDLFTFYRVPKVLFTNERFWNISADAKMLYGILLDRMSLSAKNGWIDKNGRVYIIFTIDEAKMALNCAEQKAIKGSSAIDSPRAQIVSWETVAERIGELLENGRFATNVELVEASGYERQKLAESLWHLYHDLSEEARSSNYLAILHQEPFRGFPDETADLAEKLDDPRFHATLVQQYSEFRKTLAENPDLLRFHYHKLNLIQKQLYELNMPLREYQTDMMQMPLVRQFITDDEVNADLTRGSGFSGGKARIYNYWQENHSAKEKMDFLKHEYGTGGHSHACSGATHSGQDHDAKGVAYTKSGCDKLQITNQ
ncbi:hypothetical protein DWX64_11670 [Clostridium sp. AF20-17LB]|nr:replication initiator protein A [Clostridium sp. AF20-17LB]RHR02687.1 hypothetical protein DWX64_11670 [Clostridium sp. AF20-17LB]